MESSSRNFRGGWFLDVWTTHGILGSSMNTESCLCEEGVITPLPPPLSETLFPPFFYLHCELPTLSPGRCVFLLTFLFLPGPGHGCEVCIVSLTGPTLTRALDLVWCSVVTDLKFLEIFEQQALHFALSHEIMWLVLLLAREESFHTSLRVVVPVYNSAGTSSWWMER